MSAENTTKYLNDSSLHYEKNQTGGITFSQTLLLTPFAVFFVILLSILAYYTVKKRALSKRQHHLVPLYQFDAGECYNWEDEILEHPTKLKSQKGQQDWSSSLNVLDMEKWEVLHVV